MNQRKPQRGYILMSVVITITLLAAIAFMINNESALETHSVGSELAADRVDYLAEAAINHASWLADNNDCAGDTSLVSTTFGSGSYSASLDAAATSTTLYSLNPDRDSWIDNSKPAMNYGADDLLSSYDKSGKIFQSLFHYDLSAIPGGQKVVTATAWFYLIANDPNAAVTLHSVTADWTEAGASWNNMQGNFNNEVLAMIPPQPEKNLWVAVNVTALAQSWVNNPATNFGFLLNASFEQKQTDIASREAVAGQRPYLQITTAVGAVSPLTISASATLSGKPGQGSDITRTLTRINVPAFQPAGYSVVQLQSGSGKDAMLNSFYNSRDYGDHELQVSIGSGSTLEYSLLQFELSSIPPGATILSARLGLYHYVNTGTPLDPGADVHRLMRSWVEGTHGGTGSADGATWDTWDGSSNWSSAGGDYDPTPVASSAISAATGDWESWEIGNLVQGWINGSYSNHGLILKGTGTLDVSFASKEDVKPALHPKLSITYTCECGSPCLAPQGSGTVAMVVVDPTGLVPSDAYKKALFESWGYTVNLIGENTNAAEYSAAAASNNVFYISETVNSNQVGNQIKDVPVGVVSEDGIFNSSLGIATGSAWKVGTAINVTDTSHYITALFPPGTLDIYAAGMEQLTVSGTAAPGLQPLADSGGASALVVLDQGAALAGGGNAAGRRVMLPLGREAGFNWDYLNGNGQLLVQRALQWGTGNIGLPVAQLLFVAASTTPGVQEQLRIDLIESWGYQVNVIDDNDSQANFDTALAANEVAYVSSTVSDTTLNNKLVNASIGVVNEKANLVDEFGFSTSSSGANRTQIDITDNSHSITTGFAIAPLTIHSSPQPSYMLTGTLATGLAVLANGEGSTDPGLTVLEKGASLSGGGTAAGRRVKLPWGGDAFDHSLMNPDGETIMQRSLQWASGTGVPILPGYLDEFNVSSCDPLLDYSGSDGSLDWSLQFWTEDNEADGSCSGQIQVANDPLIDDPASFRLKVDGFGVRIYRLVDLTVFAQPTLSFDYRLANYPLDDFMRVRVSTNGGVDWTEIVRYTGPFDHTEYQSASLDLSAFIAPDTLIKFEFNGVGVTRTSYIDNVHIQQSGGGGPTGSNQCSVAGTFRDELNDRVWNGSTGSYDWATSPWLEFGETDGASSGDVQILNDQSNYQLRIQDNNNGGEGVERLVDLSGAASATLSFNYRRESLDNTNDYVAIYASSSGIAGPWTELPAPRIEGSGTDGSYLSYSRDISAYISHETAIRLLGSPNLGGTDRVFFDDIEISCAP